MAFGKPAGFGGSLATPPGAGSFGSKRNLLKQMVRNIKPTKISTKKASIKGQLAKSAGKSMASKASSLTGGSPFSLKSGMGNVGGTSADVIHGAGGANLGASGVF